MPAKSRILVGSPIRRKPAILRHFLDGLADLDRYEGGLDFAFIDDNDDDESRAILRDWDPPVGRGIIVEPKGFDRPAFVAQEDGSHGWNATLAARVASFRNHLLQMGKEGDYEGVFLVDSDLVLRPDTLRWLTAAEKDIVAEAFWTQFFKSDWTVPNAWAWGECRLFFVDATEDPRNFTEEEIHRRIRAWFSEIRVPGLHEVAGTGACILISRAVIDAGVDYTPVPRLGWWGEDRFFQVRSAVAGFSTWLDTHCPPLHLYRESDLERVEAWKAEAREAVSA